MLISGEAAQEAFGAHLAACCQPPITVFLQGDLGTGKTTLVRGFLRGLGYSGKVKSPTYTLLERYELQHMDCYHFDLYRLSSPEELEYLGIQDLLDERAVIMVEWPERGQGMLPAADLTILLEHRGNSRELTFEQGSKLGERIMSCLKTAE
jgi:tRNA threonylcarbamoyladenosine biosynthesis protein TsaE